MTPHHSDGHHRLLSAYRLATEKARVFRAAGQGIVEDPKRDTLLPTATTGADPHLLRGIPVVGHKGGFGGAILGTRPG